MEEKASMRLTFVCTRAKRLPTSMVATDRTMKSTPHFTAVPGKATMNAVRMTENAAAFGPTEKKAATGVGAPWYTAGVHIWKGAAEILKARPIATRNTASRIPAV